MTDNPAPLETKEAWALAVIVCAGLDWAALISWARKHGTAVQNRIRFFLPADADPATTLAPWSEGVNSLAEFVPIQESRTLTRALLEFSNEQCFQHFADHKPPGLL